MSECEYTQTVERKRAMRAQARRARAAIPPDVRASKSHAICTRIAEILAEQAGGADPTGIVTCAAASETSFARSSAHSPSPASPEQPARHDRAPLAGAVVAVYAAFPEEANLDELADACFAQGARVAFPCMNPRESYAAPMHMRAVGADALHAGCAPFVTDPLARFAPDDAALDAFPFVAPEQIDAIIVPLVAFDGAGMRLGYGGGNYDAYLALLDEKTAVVGAAFREQRVDRVPAEPHDRPLPLIVCA